jgi:hypothetical protein
MNIARPPVRGDSTYAYADKTSGRTISFTPKADEEMVTFAGQPTPDTVNDVLTGTPLLSVSQGINAERGFAAVYVRPNISADDRAAVEARPEVANTIPVLIDEYGASRYFLPDELTVQFRDGVSEDDAVRTIEERGSEIITRQRTPGYFTIAVPNNGSLFETIRTFTELDTVLFAEPSEVSFNSALAYVPDDLDFARLWGMRNTAQTVNGVKGTADADIRATDAWTVTRGDPNVIIAVIDSGADLDHPDLQPNILPRGGEDWDFADLNDPVPDDLNGHGTHVAGTVAGSDNAIGVVGVAPGCRIMPLRIDLQTGMNQNRADAINYVRAQAAANPNRSYVVNCSWRTNGDHAGVRTAIQNAVAGNVVIVFAAGNDNVNTDVSPRFPGVYPEVISVAALDQSDRRANFSNFGSTVDIAAPGVNIWSTMPNDTFGFLDGTSMASPHVAGVAALIWSRHRDLVAAQVREILEATADDITATNPGFVGTLGRGRVNAFSAVTHPRLAVNNFGYDAGGWRVDKHPRFLADVTGDGRDDIVGFGDAGVWVSRNNGNGTFQQPVKVIDNFAYTAGGWRVEKHPRFLARLTKGQAADVIGFGDAGVWVSKNNGNGSFQAPTKVVDNFAYTAGGWRVEKHPRFLADLTGDGRADIVGFGNAGVWVSKNDGNGGFPQPTKVVDNFGYDAGGWRVEKHPRFLADLTGDGRADIIGFGNAGVWVSLNDGSGGFPQPTKVVNNFGYDAGGWRVDQHPRFLADLTGDGRADIVGFGNAGVWVSLNNGDGTFQEPKKVIDNFGYEAGGWRVEKHPRFLADITGDGRADVVGFGYAGVWVALNNGDGTFQPPAKVVNNFGYDAGGWRVEKHPRLLAKLNRDQRADIIGFGNAGAWVSLNQGNGTF